MSIYQPLDLTPITAAVKTPANTKTLSEAFEAIINTVQELEGRLLKIEQEIDELKNTS